MVSCKSTAKKVSFEFSSTDSEVRTTLHVFITYSGRERVKTAINSDRTLLKYRDFFSGLVKT